MKKFANHLILWETSKPFRRVFFLAYVTNYGVKSSTIENVFDHTFFLKVEICIENRKKNFL